MKQLTLVKGFEPSKSEFSQQLNQSVKRYERLDAVRNACIIRVDQGLVELRKALSSDRFSEPGKSIERHVAIAGFLSRTLRHLTWVYLKEDRPAEREAVAHAIAADAAVLGAISKSIHVTLQEG